MKKITAFFVLIIFSASLILNLGIRPVKSSVVKKDFIEVIKELTRETYRGRQSGTEGYDKAVDYLENEMKKIGIVPLIDKDTYKQSYNTEVATLKSELLKISGKSYKLMKDYMPFSRSTSGNYNFNRIFYVGAGTKESYINATDGLVIFKWYDENGRFPEGAMDRVLKAKANGAKGVFIVANGELEVGNYEHPLNGNDIGVPVLYITEALAEKVLGVSNNYISKELYPIDISINLEVERKNGKAQNLIGLIPGKQEDKAILLTTNLDGFGALPDGSYFESAKAGAVSPAMLLDLAQYYIENKPDYNIIIAIVGSKWTGNQGIKEVTKALDFNKIVSAIDIYAMGGMGDPSILYTDPDYEQFAKHIVPNIMYNGDLGNSLSSEIKNNSKNIILLRDKNTWIDDSSTDVYSNVSSEGYTKGLEYIKSLVNSIAKYDKEISSAAFNYGSSKVKLVYEKDAGREIKYLESKYFNVYFDDEFKRYLDNDYLKEIDVIYERIAKYNYYPYVGEKIKLLNLLDVKEAAKIGNRRDVYEKGHNVGGGFSRFDRPVIYCEQPALVTVAHEINHLLANFGKFAKDDLIQECQGQSFLVYYDGKQNVEEASKIINNYLQNHEAPRLIENAKNYKTILNWKVYTERAVDPFGWQNSYRTLGSMFTYIYYNYGGNAARRAIYRVYDPKFNITEALVYDLNITIDEFLESWSLWMTSSCRRISDSAEKSLKGYKDTITQYDYNRIYCNTSGKNGGNLKDIPIIKSNQSEEIVFKDDDIEYENIPYKTSIKSDRVNINSISVALDLENVYIKLKFKSSSISSFTIFLQGDTPGLKKHYYNVIQDGENTFIIKFDKKELSSFQEGLAFSFSEGNFVFVDKSVTDSICDIEVKP